MNKSQTEAELLSHNEFLKAIFESSSLGIAITDVAGNFTLVNNAYSILVGYTKDELYRMSLIGITVPEDLPAKLEMLGMLQRREIASFEIKKRYYHKDGSIVWVENHVSMVKNVHGQEDHILCVSKNVTKEAILDEERQRLVTMVENSEDFMALADNSGRAIYINPKGRALVGIDPDIDVRTLSAKDFYTPEDLEYLRNTILPALPKEGKWSGEIWLRHFVTGERIPCYARITEVHSKTGMVIGRSSTIRDLRPELAVKKALEQSELKLRYLTSSTPTALWMSDPEGNITYMNRTWLDWTGRPLEEHLGSGWALSIIPEDREESISRFLGDLRALRQYDNHFRIHHADGSIRWCNAVGAPQYDENGTFTGYVGYCADVNEQVLARQKIVEAEALLRSAIDTAELGTWQVHPLTNEFAISGRVKEWLGFAPDEPVDLESYKACVVESDELAAAMRHAEQGENNGYIDIEYRVINRRSGCEYILHSQGQTFYNDKKEPYLIIGTVRDITPQKNLAKDLERKVKQRTEALERSNYELEQYAYVASHDLQEPLRKIRVFCDRIMLTEPLSPSARHMFDRVIYSAERMSLLIKDLLDFSRLLSTGQLQQVNLNEVIKAVVVDFELKIEETGARIHIDNLPTIEGIQLQMNQLFYNLLSNSLKFIRRDIQPQITIRAAIAGEDEIPEDANGKSYYRFEFSDNGIGFSPEYAEQVFEVFKRLHTHDVYPGSGIGLAICRRIIQRHHGTIRVSSEQGKGTCFTIILPARQQ